MTMIYLLRHATGDSIGRVLNGRRPGVSMNREGREQASRLAERLANIAFVAISSSPLERAIETARPLAERRGLAILPCEDLTELVNRLFTSVLPELTAQVWASPPPERE